MAYFYFIYLNSYQLDIAHLLISAERKRE